jgi:hypothetical protein
MKPDQKLKVLKEINKNIDTIITKKMKVVDPKHNLKKDWETKEVSSYENDEMEMKTIKMNWDSKLSFNKQSNFKRVICISGSITIDIPEYNEKKILTPINSFLIPPDLEYTIESVPESELIIIFKPKNKYKQEKLV